MVFVPEEVADAAFDVYVVEADGGVGVVVEQLHVCVVHHVFSELVEPFAAGHPAGGHDEGDVLWVEFFCGFGEEVIDGCGAVSHSAAVHYLVGWVAYDCIEFHIVVVVCFPEGVSLWEFLE